MAPHILDVEFPTVEPTGAPGGDYLRIPSSAEMFGGFPAAAEKEFGGGLEKAGTAALDYSVQTARLQDQIYGSQVTADFTNKGNDLTSGFTQLQREAAVRGYPAFQKQLLDLQKQAEEAAPNLYTRAMVAQQTRYMLSYFDRVGRSHADTQRTAWSTQQAVGNALTATNTGALAVLQTPGDFNMYDQQLRTIQLEGHNHFGPDYDDLTNEQQKASLDLQVRKWTGPSVKLWVETAAENPKDPQAAEHAMQIFERYSTVIDGATRLDLQKYLDGRNENIAARNLAIRFTTPEGKFTEDASTVHRGSNFMQPSEQYGTPAPVTRELGGDHLTEVVLSSGQKVTVNKASADNFKGFLNELLSDGAPIGNVGGYNPRPGGIAGTWPRGMPGGGVLSQHTMGNAVDIGSQSGRNIVAADFRSWVEENPQKWRSALNHWSMYSGGDWSNPDLGHVEWAGQREGAWLQGGAASAGIPDQQTVIDRITNDPALAARPELQDKVLRFAIARLNLQRSAHAEDAADLANNVAGLTERARNGDLTEPFPDDLSLLGPRAAERAQLEYQSARREGEMVNAMWLAPAEQIDGFRAALSNATGDPLVRQRDLTAFNAAAAKREQQLSGSKADPAYYVIQHEPGVGAKFQALGDNPSPQQFADYAASQLAVQDRLGIPAEQQHLLLRAQATKIGATLAVPGADAKAALDGLQKSYGGYYGQVFRDLASEGHLSPSYQLIGALGDADGALLSRWLQGMGPTTKGETKAKTADEVLGEDASGSIALAIRKAVDRNDQLTQMQASWNDFGFQIATIGALHKAVQELAYAQAFYNRLDPAAAAQKAVAALADRYVMWQDGSARVPAEVNDTVRANADTILADHLDRDDIAEPPQYFSRATGGLPESPLRTATAADYKRLLRATPYWITSPDGTGLMLKDSSVIGAPGRIVTDREGKPIFVPFNAPLLPQSAAREAAEGAIQVAP